MFKIARRHDMGPLTNDVHTEAGSGFQRAYEVTSKGGCFDCRSQLNAERGEGA